MRSLYRVVLVALLYASTGAVSCSDAATQVIVDNIVVSLGSALVSCTSFTCEVGVAPTEFLERAEWFGCEVKGSERLGGTLALPFILLFTFPARRRESQQMFSRTPNTNPLASLTYLRNL